MSSKQQRKLLVTLWTVQKHISSTVLQKCFILEYMKHLTTDTWDTLIEKSRNSSGLRCTLDGRRGTTCLEKAIEKIYMLFFWVP